MIRVDCEPGSMEWVTARLGVATASCFERILTPAKLEFSKSAEKYALQLLAEQALGVPMDDATGDFLLRGSTMEAEAVAYYEMLHDVETEPAGFVLRDDRRTGCSPDRFVGSDGLQEVKCPKADTHLAYLLDEQGIGYKLQVQGQLWIAEREWNDTLSYHPTLPKALVRQYRDEPTIKAIDAAVARFHELMGDLKVKLQARGLFEGEAVPVWGLSLVGGS